MQIDWRQADCPILQVFEYLSTDLKKFMDRNGKGPSNPLCPRLIKVGSTESTNATCKTQMNPWLKHPETSVLRPDENLPPVHAGGQRIVAWESVR